MKSIKDIIESYGFEYEEINSMNEVLLIRSNKSYDICLSDWETDLDDDEILVFRLGSITMHRFSIQTYHVEELLELYEEGKDTLDVIYFMGENLLENRTIEETIVYMKLMGHIE